MVLPLVIDARPYPVILPPTPGVPARLDPISGQGLCRRRFHGHRDWGRCKHSRDLAACAWEQPPIELDLSTAALDV